MSGLIQLTADPGDPALWILPGVGTLRRTGWTSRAATAEAGGRSWELARYGLVRTGFTATDPGLLLFTAFVLQCYSDDASFPQPTPS